jgi:hypothetical protein
VIRASVGSRIVGSMSGSPFRDRRVPPDEVRRIVKRAAELAMVHADDGAGEALTDEELARRLHELGVPAEIARRAMEPDAPAQRAKAPDGSTRVTREAELDGMIPPERHEEIAEAISDAMGMAGRVSVVGNKITWVPGGVLVEPCVTVRSKGGRTHVEYVETLANRGQLLVGFGTLAALSGTIAGGVATGAGVAIAKAFEISAQQGGTAVLVLAGLLGIGAAAASGAGFLRLFERRVETRSAFADSVMARVVSAARAAVDSPDSETSAMSVRVEADDATAEDAEIDASAPSERVARE